MDIDATEWMGVPMFEKKTAVITGGSAGLGRAVARALVTNDWHVIVTARRAEGLAALAAELGEAATTIVGDISDPVHRARLCAAVSERGRLDLLMNNASELGPSPLPRLADFLRGELERVYATNVVAPVALIGALLPLIESAQGSIVNVSSDAAVEAYSGWGGYGSSKAALDHVSAVLAVEHPELRVYAFDPGDMRTAMHQAAFPGEDISDRPEPETVVPALLQLLVDRKPSGRYIAAQLMRKSVAS